MQSDLFVLDKGHLARNPDRQQAELPSVRLGGHFTELQEYQDRIPSVPGLLGLDSLEVEGDVRLGAGIQLKGEVKLTAKDKSLLIADGSVLQNETVEQ